MFERLNLIYNDQQLKTIKNSTIMIIGLGGVGSATAISLARSGVGRIILIDYDIVEKSNINRQLMAFHSTIGLLKIDILEKMILDINPLCKVTKIKKQILTADVKDLLEDEFDFLVDACDNISLKRKLLIECHFNKIKYISSTGMARRNNPTKVNIINLMDTRDDPIAKELRDTYRDYKFKHTVKVVASTETPIKSSRTLPSSCFVANVAGYQLGYYAINEIIKK